jgi:hypothetical protein
MTTSEGEWNYNSCKFLVKIELRLYFYDLIVTCVIYIQYLRSWLRALFTNWFFTTSSANVLVMVPCSISYFCPAPRLRQISAILFYAFSTHFLRIFFWGRLEVWKFHQGRLSFSGYFASSSSYIAGLISACGVSQQDGQCTHESNTEARSWKHCCCGKQVLNKYYACMYVVLVAPNYISI